MAISIKLEMMIDDIMEMNHTDSEWLEIQRDFEAYKKKLSEEELLYFAESGAGEALHMACSGIGVKWGDTVAKDDYFVIFEERIDMF